MAEPRSKTRQSALDISPRPLAIRNLDYRLRDLISRVRGEFSEMRGFSPTIEQAARLFDLSLDDCARVLSSLEREGFLRRTPDGRYRLPA
jgi:DNA-binding IclR family transcriptional regulator